MNTEKVYFGLCEEYDIAKIEKIITGGLKYLDLELPEKSKVLLKPNVLGAYPPEMHITTHPSIIEAMVRLLVKRDNKIIIGDSSGNGQHGQTSRSLKKSGIGVLASEYNVEVISFDKHPSEIFENDENHYLKRVNLSAYINEVDYIINLPKLKSHQLMSYTGAVKNLFGCVPGAGKLTCHITAPQPAQFANLLLDIYGFIKPHIFLNIIDAVYGIEGAGPGPAGTIMKPGFIALGRDAMALDAACLEVLGKDPRDIYTIKEGIKRNHFNASVEKNIELPVVPFKMPRPNYLTGLVHKYFPRFGQSRPFTVTEKCIKCSLCAKACPGKAITMNGYPSFNYKNCIYCYCCHENCPEAAIELKESLLLRIFKVFEKED